MKCATPSIGGGGMPDCTVLTATRESTNACFKEATSRGEGSFRLSTRVALLRGKRAAENDRLGGEERSPDLWDGKSR